MEKLVRERVMDWANYKNLLFGWVYRLVGGTFRKRVRAERFYAKSLVYP